MTDEVPKKRGRKPKAQTVAAVQNDKAKSLLDALTFAHLATKEIGEPYAVHFRGYGEWITGFNGVLTAGTKIPDMINVCPNADDFLSAIKKVKGDFSITVNEPFLSVANGAFSAHIPCIGHELMTNSAPDPATYSLDNNFRRALLGVAPIVSDTAQHVLEASILINGASCIATDRSVLVEYWHGNNMPRIAVPKAFAAALAKVNKNLAAFGFSERTFTVHFEDQSFLKTQLYEGEYPDVSSILPQEPGNLKELSSTFWEGVEAVAPFAIEHRIYFGDGKVASHVEALDATPAKIGAWHVIPDDMGDIAVNAKRLQLVKPFLDLVRIDGEARRMIFWNKPNPENKLWRGVMTTYFQQPTDDADTAE